MSIARVSWRLVIVVLAALAGASATIVVATTGHGQKQPPPSIQGPQLRLGDLTYNVTNVRLLDRGKPVDAPYLVNLQAPPKGTAYLGVFLKIYNHNLDKDQPMAPGYLLEPSSDPSLVEMQQASESPYQLEVGTVPAGGQLPIPGSPSAAGPIAGGLLLYIVDSEMIAAQPLRLIINTGSQIGAIKLPRVPKLSGGAGHGH